MTPDTNSTGGGSTTPAENVNDQIHNDDDSNDKRTSSTGSSTIYQIDPSGQYWICQAVVSGRYASMIEQQLHRRLLERYSLDVTRRHQSQPPPPPQQAESSSATTLSRSQVCAVLSQLSIEDAVTLATQCLLDGMTQGSNVGGTKDPHRHRSRIRLRGMALSSTNNNNDLSIQIFTNHGLHSRR